MDKKEVNIRIKINGLLEEAGWLFIEKIEITNQNLADVLFIMNTEALYPK